MRTSCLVIISAAAFVTSSAFATDYLLSGGTNEENATKFSSDIKNSSGDVVTPTDSDGVLWTGLNSGVATAPAYTVVDGKYSFKSFMVSGDGGSYTDLNMLFEDGAALTLSSGDGIGFSAYPLAMDFSVKNGGNAAINFTNGWTLTAPVGTGRSGSTASIKIGRGITVTSSEAVTVKSDDANTVFTVDGVMNVTGASYFTNGINNFNGTYTTSGNAAFNGTVANIGGNFSANETTVQNSTLNIGKDAVYTTSRLELTPDNGDATTASNLVVNGTLNINDYFYVSKHDSITPKITIGEGASINAQTFRSIATPITLAKDSTMVLYNHSSNVGETFANGGLFTIKNGASLLIFTDSATCAAGKNYEEIVLDKGGKLAIRGGKYFALGNAMTLNDALDIDTHLAFGKNTDTNAGSLVVNADNTWKKTAFLVSKSYNDNKPSSSYGKITIGDNVSLTARGIAFATGEAAQFEINLGNGSVLTFDEFIVADIAGYGLVGGDTIVISGFAEKSLAINKHNSLADDALAYMQISGVDSSKLSWAFDTATNKYWLTVVPEPAEWAAIFGALALGFVIYRRRK